MTKISVFIFIFFGCFLVSFSQEIPSFDQCDSFVKPKDYCYEFFEENTFEGEKVPLIYEWDFGDGNKKRGIKVEHCYAKPDVYTVNLNIVDTILGSLELNVTSYQLNLNEVKAVYIEKKESILIAEATVFEAHLQDSLLYEEVKYYWFVDDNLLQEGGKKCKVTFEQYNKYVLKLGVVAKKDGEEVKLCTTETINIARKPNNSERYVFVGNKTGNMSVIKEKVENKGIEDDSLNMNEEKFSQKEHIHLEGDKNKYSIYFGSSKYKLDAEDVEILTDLYNDYDEKKNVIKSVRLEGYADATNTSSYNKTLSDLRVKSVSDYLIKLGISEDILIEKGLGESNSTMEDNSKQLNRRVVITFIYK